MATGNKTFESSLYATNPVAYPYFNNIHTDISRVRSDWFSSQVKTVSRPSAAFRLITPNFFTNFFMVGGRTSRSAAVVIGSLTRKVQPLGYVPLFSDYSLFYSCFIMLSGRGAKQLSPTFIYHPFGHGLSVRIFQFFLFGGVRPFAAIGFQGVRPSFLRLYEQLFHNKLIDWGMGEGRSDLGFSRAFAPIHCFSYENLYY